MKEDFPNFDINLENYIDELDSLLMQQKKATNLLLEDKATWTWDKFIMPLQEMSAERERIWAPFSHLQSVKDSALGRKVQEECLPKLSLFETELLQSQTLLNAIKTILKENLNSAQQKILQDFCIAAALSGVDLDDEKKAKLQDIEIKLANLSSQYEHNVLDATFAYHVNIKDEDAIKSLPQHIISNAKKEAQKHNEDGFRLTLEQPVYLAIMTYLDDRKLREDFYYANMTRASELGPNANAFDNSKLMNEILNLKDAKALLLGFENYAQLSLSVKMAENTQNVEAFLEKLTDKCYAQGKTEFTQLQDFARQNLGIDELKPWDVSYSCHKFKQAKFCVDAEVLREYFPVNKVLDGICTILKRLYGITLKRESEHATWHQDAHYYAVIDENNTILGYIVMDLFAREHKRAGAWMDSLRTRYIKTDGSLQKPIATLTCSFAKASQDKEAKLSHDEVLTLFHELGHCLQHVLTKVDYWDASGIHGIEWDAVELPSQFFENWAWQFEAIKLLSADDSGKHMPLELWGQWYQAKNFQSALFILRQLEFALFDLYLHKSKIQTYEQILKILQEVRQKTAFIDAMPYHRFQNSFTHIFSGGYAAGYYGYLWAEVLSSDAFSKFEEEGIWNTKTGHEFWNAILAPGGTIKAHTAFINFRGRDYSIDAFLRHNFS